MSKQMRNKGMRQRRFSTNPMEESFAKAWEEENPEGRAGILGYLLAENPNAPVRDICDEDREVAATIIQWLGSPVGQGFLNGLGFHHPPQ